MVMSRTSGSHTFTTPGDAHRLSIKLLALACMNGASGFFVGPILDESVRLIHGAVAARFRNSEVFHRSKFAHDLHQGLLLAIRGKTGYVDSDVLGVGLTKNRFVVQGFPFPVFSSRRFWESHGSSSCCGVRFRSRPVNTNLSLPNSLTIEPLYSTLSIFPFSERNKAIPRNSLCLGIPGNFGLLKARKETSSQCPPLKRKFIGIFQMQGKTSPKNKNQMLQTHQKAFDPLHLNSSFR